jgi:serine/threonine-protein kinase
MPVVERLRAVNKAEVEKQVKAQATRAVELDERDKRGDLFTTAKTSFEGIMRELVGIIQTNASRVEITEGSLGSWKFKLGLAELETSMCVRTSPNALAEPNHPVDRPSIDVISHNYIRLKFPRNRWGYEGRSHSLWYSDAVEKGVYRWFETAFMIHPLIASSLSPIDPFNLDPTPKSGEPLSPIMGRYQVAWPFTPFDQGGQASFIERWLGWFCDAAAENLMHPSQMPEREAQGSWRRK